MTALLLTQRLVALSVLLQTIELGRLRGAVSDQGIWPWQVLRDDFEGCPGWVRRVLDLTLAYPNFLGLLALQALASLALFWWLGAAPVLVLTTVLISLRWRGAFNGGSDYMTVTVLLALAVAAIVHHPVMTLACLWYVALQCCLSYFVAGIVKLNRANWRNGRALSAFTGGRLGPPRAARLSWAVIGFQCAFPLVLLVPELGPVFVLGAVGFHLANFYFLGLNRFFWAWLATYPALFYCAGYR
ncbi:MAG: hypothetical protein AB7S38_17915 [Vulcanimicrobiota bacterium]